MITRIRTTLAATAVLGLLAPLPDLPRSVVRAQPPSDALAIIVNRSNPVDGLTLAELRRIFMLETQTWPHGRKITLVLREKGQPERGEAIRLICGVSEADYDRHVLYQTFSGLVGWGPRSILSSSAMMRFVFNAPGAIGYVPSEAADRTTKTLRINNLLPGDPQYPLRRRGRRDESRSGG